MIRNRAFIIGVVLATVCLLGAGTQAEVMKAGSKSEFVGSETCQTCHKVEADSWKLTYHSKLIGKKEQRMLKDAVEKWETDGFNPGPTKGNVTGKSFSRGDVEFTIGSKWKQRYLVKDDETGGYQFLDKQFNRMSGKWENYGQKNDWNTMCATCHTTGYRLVEYDPANLKGQKAEWVETSIGCEACHGPGAKHVQSKSKEDIWNFTGKQPAEQARVCGYCHIRLENQMFDTAQGNPREDFPAPKVGESFKPSDDWTKWYPDQVVIPGVQSQNPFDKQYAGDLKGLFIVDETSKKNGVFEEAKHHQEYQGFIQSKHYKTEKMSCLSCHSPHATKTKKMLEPAQSCANCHDPSFTVEKYMPGTGKTAENLFVRSHTFVKDQQRKGLPTSQGVPVFYK